MDCNVSTHSRPKAAAINTFRGKTPKACFNSQPPEGGCRPGDCTTAGDAGFNSQPPEGGCAETTARQPGGKVSTHSRPKAAAITAANSAGARRRFNSQPPEGGCIASTSVILRVSMFQLTAARRRLLLNCSDGGMEMIVSTHSRPKAAAYWPVLFKKANVFQLTAARRRLPQAGTGQAGRPSVSTHSRPKAAASSYACRSFPRRVSTHSRPKAAALCIKIREKSVNYQ